MIYINNPRGDSVIILKGSLLRLNFDVLHAATNKGYMDADNVRLINLGPIALFDIYKTATCSGNTSKKLIMLILFV